MVPQKQDCAVLAKMNCISRSPKNTLHSFFLQRGLEANQISKHLHSWKARNKLAKQDSYWNTVNMFDKQHDTNPKSKAPSTKSLAKKRRPLQSKLPIHWRSVKLGFQEQTIPENEQTSGDVTSGTTSWVPQQRAKEHFSMDANIFRANDQLILEAWNQ